MWNMDKFRVRRHFSYIDKFIEHYAGSYKCYSSFNSFGHFVGNLASIILLTQLVFNNVP